MTRSRCWVSRTRRMVLCVIQTFQPEKPAARKWQSKRQAHRNAWSNKLNQNVKAFVILLKKWTYFVIIEINAEMVATLRKKLMPGISKEDGSVISNSKSCCRVSWFKHGCLCPKNYWYHPKHLHKTSKNGIIQWLTICTCYITLQTAFSSC